MIFFLRESLNMLSQLSKGIKIPDLDLKFKALYMQKMDGDEASIEQEEGDWIKSGDQESMHWFKAKRLHLRDYF